MSFADLLVADNIQRRILSISRRLGHDLLQPCNPMSESEFWENKRKKRNGKRGEEK